MQTKIKTSAVTKKTKALSVTSAAAARSTIDATAQIVPPMAWPTLGKRKQEVKVKENCNKTLVCAESARIGHWVESSSTARREGKEIEKMRMISLHQEISENAFNWEVWASFNALGIELWIALAWPSLRLGRCPSRSYTQLYQCISVLTKFWVLSNPALLMQWMPIAACCVVVLGWEKGKNIWI